MRAASSTSFVVTGGDMEAPQKKRELRCGYLLLELRDLLDWP